MYRLPPQVLRNCTRPLTRFSREFSTLSSSIGASASTHTASAAMPSVTLTIKSKPMKPLPAVLRPKTIDNAIKRVVIFRKISLYERRTTLDHATSCKSLDDEKIKHSHLENMATLQHIQQIVANKNVEIDVVKDLSDDHLRWADMVISVGGDGTFLKATQTFAEREQVPILAVNSSPKSSYGFFCAATRDNFDQVFHGISSGSIKSFPLWRMKILLNGKPLNTLAINDVLFAGSTPAETVAYNIKYKGQAQTHVSSGIWISTPAGSTAAIASAGGLKMDLTDRLLQFRVRELFAPSVVTPPIVGGVIDNDFELVCRMPNAKLYIDGNNTADVKFGDQLVFKVADHPLQWYRPTHPEAYWGSDRWRAPWEKPCNNSQQHNDERPPTLV